MTGSPASDAIEGPPRQNAPWGLDMKRTVEVLRFRRQTRIQDLVEVRAPTTRPTTSVRSVVLRCIDVSVPVIRQITGIKNKGARGCWVRRQHPV